MWGRLSRPERSSNTVRHHTTLSQHRELAADTRTNREVCGVVDAGHNTALATSPRARPSRRSTPASASTLGFAAFIAHSMRRILRLWHFHVFVTVRVCINNVCDFCRYPCRNPAVCRRRVEQIWSRGCYQAWSDNYTIVSNRLIHNYMLGPLNTFHYYWNHDSTTIASHINGLHLLPVRERNDICEYAVVPYADVAAASGGLGRIMKTVGWVKK